MHNLESALSLEPLFCKGTGAYRAEVSRFCHFAPNLDCKFELARPQKPVLLEAESWRTTPALGSKLQFDKDLLIKHGVQSTHLRSENNVTAIIHPLNGFILEMKNFSSGSKDFTIDVFLKALKEECRELFDSCIITLLRHGILLSETINDLRSTHQSHCFQAENWTEVLRIDNKMLARSLISGRIIDLKGIEFIAEVILSNRVWRAEEQSAEIAKDLCRLGMLRQITNIDV